MGTCSSVQRNYSHYARLCVLLIDNGTRIYRDIFDSIHSSKSLQTLLNDPNIKHTLRDLKNRGVLSEDHWNGVYPTNEISTDISSSSFDITLLSFLLKTVCCLKCPTTGWNNAPLSSDISMEADLARITVYRNMIHDNSSQISNKDFLENWSKIEDAFIRLGGAQYKEDVDKLKDVLNVQDNQRFIQMLKNWKEGEEKLIKTIGEIGKGNAIERQIVEVQVSNKQGVDAYMHELKRSVKSYIEALPNYNVNTLVTMKTEDIFRIRVTDTPPSSTAKTGNDQSNSFEIEKCSQMFINKQGDKNPKRIVIMAGQGVGKSLFCMKFLRDWSMGQLFDGIENGGGPNIKFVYFLTFRELNLMDCNLSLTGLLNLCSMLDSDSIIDEALVAYFSQQSEQVLILMDGIDEFAHFNQMGSTFDNRFPDDVHFEMPVAVLCAKLLQRKLLEDSVIMVTSRPDEAKDVMKMVHFDRYLEISSSTTKNVSGPFRYQFW